MTTEIEPPVDVDDPAGTGRTLWERLHYSLGPLAGGMIIDLTDLLTPGPVGVFGGLLIGMPVGWYVASLYGFSTPSRLLIATLSGIYCTIPGTELIPLATLVSAVGRFFADESQSPRGTVPTVELPRLAESRLPEQGASASSIPTDPTSSSS